MNEQAPQPDMLEILRNEVGLIDQQIDSAELADDEQNELLDKREGLRLLMAADAMTRLENDPLPPIANRELAAEYLRPSKYGELQQRLLEIAKLEEEGSHAPDKAELELIYSVTERDKGPRRMVNNYAKNSGEPAGETWIDTATGIRPRTE